MCVCGYASSCAVSPVVSKASAGAMEVMDVCQVDGRYRSIRQLTQVTVMWKEECLALLMNFIVTVCETDNRYITDYTQIIEYILGNKVLIIFGSLSNPTQLLPPPTQK